MGTFFTLVAPDDVPDALAVAPLQGCRGGLTMGASHAWFRL